MIGAQDNTSRLNELLSRPALWLVLLAVLLAVQISPWWHPTPDACAYLSIARSVVSGGALTNLGSPHLWYAPGYPLLISPAFLLGDRPFLWLSVLQWLFFIAYLAGVYRWASRQMPAGALLITALSVCNLSLWIHFRRTLSEMAFMAVMMAVINALGDSALATSFRRRWGLTAVGALLLALLALIRPAGVVFAAGFGVFLLVKAARGQYPWARVLGQTVLAAVPSALTVLSVMAYSQVTAAQAGERTYVDNFADANYLEGLRLMISECGRVSVPGMFKCYTNEANWLDVNAAVYLGVMIVLLIGWWRLVRDRQDLLALSFPFYMFLHVLYAMDSGARFLVPMLPLLAVCAWYVLDSCRAKRIVLLRVLVAGHLAVALVHWLAVELPQERRINAEWPEVQRVAEMIRAQPRPVVAPELTNETALMLELALDRPIHCPWVRPFSDEGPYWRVLERRSLPSDASGLFLLAGRYVLVSSNQPD